MKPLERPTPRMASFPAILRRTRHLMFPGLARPSGGRRRHALVGAFALLWAALMPAGAVPLRGGDTLVVAFEVVETPVLSSIPRPPPGSGPPADTLLVILSVLGQPGPPFAGDFVIELFRGPLLLASFGRRIGVPGEGFVFAEPDSVFTFGMAQGTTRVVPGLSDLAQAGRRGEVRVSLEGSDTRPLDVRVTRLQFGRGQASNAIAAYVPDPVIRSQELLRDVPVPAPPSWALLLPGALGLLACSLRRRQA